MRGQVRRHANGRGNQLRWGTWLRRSRLVGVLMAAGLVVGLTGVTDGAQAKLNCDVPKPPPACGGDPEPAPTPDHPPTGALDALAPASSGLRVRGWAKDPDTTSAISVRLYLDGVLVQTVRASAYRAGVGNYGFDVTVATAPGAHSLRAVGVNVGDSAASPSIGTQNLDLTRAPTPPGVWANASTVAPRIRLTLWDTNHYYQDHVGSYGIERTDYASSYPATYTEVARIPVANLNPNTQSFEWYEPDLSLPRASLPCYRIVGYTATGSSLPTERICVTNGPAPPTNVQIDYVAPDRITVSWTDNSTDEWRWDVYSGDMTTWESRQASPHVTLPAHAGTGRMSATITGLTSGQRYCITIVNPGFPGEAASFPAQAPCVPAGWPV